MSFVPQALRPMLLAEVAWVLNRAVELWVWTEGGGAAFSTSLPQVPTELARLVELRDHFAQASAESAPGRIDIAALYHRANKRRLNIDRLVKKLGVDVRGILKSKIGSWQVSTKLEGRRHSAGGSSGRNVQTKRSRSMGSGASFGGFSGASSQAPEPYDASRRHDQHASNCALDRRRGRARGSGRGRGQRGRGRHVWRNSAPDVSGPGCGMVGESYPRARKSASLGVSFDDQHSKIGGPNSFMEQEQEPRQQYHDRHHSAASNCARHIQLRGSQGVGDSLRCTGKGAAFQSETSTAMRLASDAMSDAEPQVAEVLHGRGKGDHVSNADVETLTQVAQELAERQHRELHELGEETLKRCSHFHSAATALQASASTRLDQLLKLVSDACVRVAEPCSFERIEHADEDDSQFALDSLAKDLDACVERARRELSLSMFAQRFPSL